MLEGWRGVEGCRSEVEDRYNETKDWYNETEDWYNEMEEIPRDEGKGDGEQTKDGGSIPRGR